jgi:hypothetical protein
MDITEAAFGFITGIVSSLVPRFFRSKKENDEFLLELVKTLRSEVERMHLELGKVREEYDSRLKSVQAEYNQLLSKYNTLKKDFQDYKNNNK